MAAFLSTPVLLTLLSAQVAYSVAWIQPKETIVSLNSSLEMPPHILQNPDFWKIFSTEVEKKKWKCSFSKDVLSEGLESDLELYKDGAILTRRRNAAIQWVKNDSLWIKIVLGACREIASGKPGPFLRQFEQLRADEALKDFVEHIHYFYTVASTMEARGAKVTVIAQDMSAIHDIDKLDPVMIVGYSERFEDLKNTSLWNRCVERHTHINTHHQQHCLWHNCCQTADAQSCNETRSTALNEMVCDKVSRRLQKNFSGVQSREMWDADLIFYKGLPEDWLQKASELQDSMKNWENSKYSIC